LQIERKNKETQKFSSVFTKELWHEVIYLFLNAEKGLLHSLGHAMGRRIVSIQLIFSHLWDTDMNYRFK
jgi:hypothetical protein